MIESAYQSNAKKGIWAARALVSVENREVPILVRNPSDEPIQLNVGMTAALLHQVAETPIPVNSVSRTGNNQGSDEGVTSTVFEDEDLPEHLQQVYENGIKLLSEDEALGLKNLLRKYGSVFSRNSSDTGVTDKTEHRIDTRDS